MNKKQLQEIINSGEGLTVEFKECRDQVSRNVYEKTTVSKQKTPTDHTAMA